MYRLDLGISIKPFQKDGPNENFFRDLKELRKQGFQSVEVSLGRVGGYKMTMEQCIFQVEDALKAVRDEGLTLNSIHMPFQRFIYISSYDEGVRAWAIDEFRRLIAICDNYQPSHYVFHSKVGRLDDEYWELRKPALIRSFRDMVACTRNNMCMENMVSSFPNSVANMIEVLQQVEGGKCCIDTNHFLMDKTSDAILALKDWVTTIHVSDFDGVYEKHWMPKQGVNNWMKIIGALEEIGFKGAFTYELYEDKYGYTFAEIRENYEKLFEEYNKSASK